MDLRTRIPGNRVDCTRNSANIWQSSVFWKRQPSWITDTDYGESTWGGTCLLRRQESQELPAAHNSLDTVPKSGGIQAVSRLLACAPGRLPPIVFPELCPVQPIPSRSPAPNTASWCAARTSVSPTERCPWPWTVGTSSSRFAAASWAADAHRPSVPSTATIEAEGARGIPTGSTPSRVATGRASSGDGGRSPASLTFSQAGLRKRKRAGPSLGRPARQCICPGNYSLSVGAVVTIRSLTFSLGRFSAPWSWAAATFSACSPSETTMSTTADARSSVS